MKRMRRVKRRWRSSLLPVPRSLSPPLYGCRLCTESCFSQASRPDVFAHTVPSPKWSPLPDDLARSTPEIKREEDE